MRNFSDGKTDGLVLVYVKDGTAYPIAIHKEDLAILDACMPMYLRNGVNVVKDRPIGKVDLLKGRNAE